MSVSICVSMSVLYVSAYITVTVSICVLHVCVCL